MAFVSSSSPDQAQDPNQQGQNPLSQQAPMTSAPNAGAGKAAVTPSSSAPTQPFTNLSSYLSANDPQIKQMGSDVAGNLTAQYGQIQNDINQAGQNFQGQVAAGYTPNQPDVISAFTANPSDVAADPTKAAAFKGMYGDTYTGPANFETSPEYGQLSERVQQGQATANQVGSGGLASYLTSTNPNYTQGQATLDAALLQGNPEVQAQIQAAAAPYANLPGYLSAAVTSGDQAVQNAVQQAQAAKAAAQAAGSQVSGDFSGRLNGLYQNTVQKGISYNNMLNDITGKIGNGDLSSLTPEEQSLIGFNSGVIPYIQQYPSIFASQAQSNPLNPASFYTQGTQAPVASPSDIVSSDDIATYQALQALTGNAPSLNFDMPLASTVGSPTSNMAASGQPGQLPSFNNLALLSSIIQAYGPMYDQMKASGFSGVPSSQVQTIENYMNGVYGLANQPQPGSQPTTPPPSPGTSGDLGAGFHWDSNSGQWVPTIPLQPVNPPPSDGGGHHAY